MLARCTILAMKVLSTTEFRKKLPSFLDQVVADAPIVIGRRNKPEAILIKYPEYLNKNISTISNVNANSPSFDFLKDEPELYSIKDLITRYV